MSTTPNPHLAKPFLREGSAPVDAVGAAVLVHGRGQDPDYMKAIAGRIGLADLHSVYPEAASNTWYPGRYMAPVEENEPSLGHALRAVDVALSELAEAGIGANRTILIGFSQGACLLAEHLVRAPQAYRAVVLLSGEHLGQDGHVTAIGGTLPATPILLSSSVVDEWIPAHRVRATAELLQTMGAAVTVRLHGAPEHGASDEDVEVVRNVLAAAPS